jgi:hypothetical protein
VYVCVCVCVLVYVDVEKSREGGKDGSREVGKRKLVRGSAGRYGGRWGVDGGDMGGIWGYMGVYGGYMGGRWAEELSTHYTLTVTGALIQGFLMKKADFSSLLIITGGMNMPGAAMPIREGMTCVHIIGVVSVM